MRATVYTLGCKVNQYESEEIRTLLTRNGFLVDMGGGEADVIVVNSCAVTHESTRKTMQAVRRLRRLNPNSVIAVTGCAPQAFPKEFISLKEADIITGHRNAGELASKIKAFIKNGVRIDDVTPFDGTESYYGTGAPSMEGHTRAFLKIQDGCDRRCTYCAIPMAKGRSRSKSTEDVKKELLLTAERGIKEVVLIGINLSSYGLERGENVGDAVLTANDTKGIERIRLGSLEPDLMTDDVIQKLKSCQKFCPHFHLSLQSGSDRILKLMNRRYTAEEYIVLADRLREEFDGASITTDIIVGFPGETKEDELMTQEFCKKVGFEKVHVFPFSLRAGTPAEKLPGRIPQTEIRQRAKRLIKTTDEIRAEKLSLLKGRTLGVLFETPSGGMQRGYSENYTPVRLECDEELTNTVRKVKVIRCLGDHVVAELIS